MEKQEEWHLMKERFFDKSNLHCLGSDEILNNYKIAFLCSKDIQASVVLKTYDWAIFQRESHRCIISGFHSQIEKDVFHFLLKGDQPIILVLARGIMKNFSTEIKKAVHSKKLLIISAHSEKVTTVNMKNAEKRNFLMIDLCDELFVPFAAPNSMTEKMVEYAKNIGKKVVVGFEEL